MKVVLDTNVLASGIFWSGYPFEIIQAVDEGRLEMVMTKEIFNEYTRVITSLGHRCKKGMNVGEILNTIKIKAHWSTPVLLAYPVCEDSDDDKFIECAVSAKVKLIVSGDKLLLRCSGYHSIDILPPRSFVMKYLLKEK